MIDYSYQMSASSTPAAANGALAGQDIPMLAQAKMRLIGMGVPAPIANALVPTSISLIALSALGGVAGFHIAKARKSTTAGQIGWVLGSFGLPFLVPSIGAIMMVRK